MPLDTLRVQKVNSVMKSGYLVSATIMASKRLSIHNKGRHCCISISKSSNKVHFIPMLKMEYVCVCVYVSALLKCVKIQVVN